MNATRTMLLILVLSSSSVLAADRDFDGVDDAVDNCLEVANPSQCDDDGDGIGNHCDADLNNDCIVNSFDLQILRQNFGLTEPNDADLDCNGVVNTFDLGRMRDSFGLAPGPSTRFNGCAVACGTEHPDNRLPMKWNEPPRSGQIVPGSNMDTEICADGAKMFVEGKGLLPNHAYTMWFGWFDKPDECLFPPPQPESGSNPKLRCGFLDLFHDEPDGNFIFGDGGVADHQGFLDFKAMVLTGVDPKGTPFTGQYCGGPGQPECTDCDSNPDDNLIDYRGPTCQCIDGQCKNDWSAGVRHDDHPGRLRNPTTAEYHTVFLNHGPDDPEHPDQTTSHDGGCLGFQENDPGTPDDDVDAEPYWPCRGEQSSGAVSEVPSECFDQGRILPECITGILSAQPGGFVFGSGRGEPVGTDFYTEVEIVAQRTVDDATCGATQGIGLCKLNHYERDPLTGDLEYLFTVHAELDCVSAPSSVAYTTGTIVDFDGTDDPNVLAQIGDPIAVTIGDTNSVADTVRVNFPDADIELVPELEGMGGLPNGNGDFNPVTNCGCQEGIATFETEPQSFWVAD